MSLVDAPTASVTVTRVRRTGSSARDPYRLWVDGREMASLENGSSVRIELAPGPHRLVLHWTSRKSNPLDLTLKEGDHVMLECGLVPSVFLMALVLREVGSAGRPFSS